MQLNELQPNTKRKKSKRIGRGGKRGTFSGRGVKGQKARAGRVSHPIIRELIKHYPKLRGYNNTNRSGLARLRSEVKISDLDKSFKTNDEINPKVLIKQKLVKKKKNRLPQIKILANGETKKKFIIRNCKVSEKAQEKIEKAGGKVI